MKILLISNAFPNSSEPVRGIFTYQIAKALQKKSEIEVVAPLPWVPSFLGKKFSSQYPHANVPAKERVGDIQVYHPRYLVIPKILGFMHALFMFFPLLKLIRKMDKHEKIDLINAHWIFPDGVASVWVGKMLKKHVVLTGLGCDVNLYSTMFFRKIQIINAIQQAAYVTVVSKNMKRRIVSLGIREEQVAVIPNGVDLKLFDLMEKKRVRSTLNLPGESRIILTIGSQDEVKGTKYLIEAFGTLRKKQKGLFLILIGDGPLRKSLVSMSKDLGLYESVVFLGRKPHGEIPLWLNAADVFCLPSIREGHPNVVLEALACGVPVVASNIGAIPEMIHHDNGRLSPPADSKILCENLEFCLSNNWDRNAIRTTLGDFSWMECAQMYFESYLRIVKTNSNRASTKSYAKKNLFS